MLWLVLCSLNGNLKEGSHLRAGVRAHSANAIIGSFAVIIRSHKRADRVTRETSESQCLPVTQSDQCVIVGIEGRVDERQGHEYSPLGLCGPRDGRRGGWGRGVNRVSGRFIRRTRATAFVPFESQAVCVCLESNQRLSHSQA